MTHRFKEGDLVCWRHNLNVALIIREEVIRESGYWASRLSEPRLTLYHSDAALAHAVGSFVGPVACDDEP